MSTITFIDDDFHSIDPNHDDPMFITIEWVNFTIMKTLEDKGILMDILYSKIVWYLRLS